MGVSPSPVAATVRYAPGVTQPRKFTQSCAIGVTRNRSGHRCHLTQTSGPSAPALYFVSFTVPLVYLLRCHLSWSPNGAKEPRTIRVDLSQAGQWAFLGTIAWPAQS